MDATKENEFELSKPKRGKKNVPETRSAKRVKKDKQGTKTKTSSNEEEEAGEKPKERQCKLDKFLIGNSNA